MADLLLLPLVALHLVLLLLSTRLHILVIVAAVVVELFLVHVNDVGAHPVQEVLAAASDSIRQAKHCETQDEAHSSAAFLGCLCRRLGSR